MNLTSYLLMTLTYFGQYSAISAKQSKPWKQEGIENCECLYKNRCYIKISVLHNIIITSIIIYEF